MRSITTLTPPSGAAIDDAYLIPSGAVGEWQGKVGQIALRDGDGWVYLTPQDGHGIGLPDGRIFIKHGGSYTEKLATDVQSGKWLYAVAEGTENELTATLSPSPHALIAGLTVRLKITQNNTGPVTLNINGLGVAEVKNQKGNPLENNALIAGQIVDFIYDGAGWCAPSIAVPFIPPSSSSPPANALGQNGYQFLPGGTIIQWGRVMANIGKSQTYSFPIAFPNGCTSIVGAINVGVIFPWSHLNIYVTGGYWVAMSKKTHRRTAKKLSTTSL